MEVRQKTMAQCYCLAGRELFVRMSEPLRNRVYVPEVPGGDPKLDLILKSYIKNGNFPGVQWLRL